MSRDCRDCPACTRSLIGRLTLLFMLVPFMAAMVRPMMKTCGQCGHVLSRHQRIQGRFVD